MTLRSLPLALALILVPLAAGPADAAPWSPWCAGLGDPDLCIGEHDCAGVYGDASGPNRYQGVAYCSTGSACYVWENGQRIDTEPCGAVRWWLVPNPDEARDEALQAVEDARGTAEDVLDEVRSSCVDATDPHVCTGGYGCYGLVGYPGGPNDAERWGVCHDHVSTCRVWTGYSSSPSFRCPLA